MKTKMEIAGNGPLRGDWKYVIKLGRTQVGYNNPSVLTQFPHIKEHARQELELESTSTEETDS